MTPQIRPARVEDLAACVDLLDDLFRLETDFAPDAGRQIRGLSQLLESDAAQLMVADDDGEVVGMLSVQRLISTAQGSAVGIVEDVVVRDRRRGQGIGRALMDAAEAWARDEGLTRLQLLAERGNHPANALYQRLGWTSTPFSSTPQSVDKSHPAILAMYGGLRGTGRIERLITQHTSLVSAASVKSTSRILQLG